MKKSILSSVFMALMFLVCGIFYGCGGRYDNLSMSAYFSYDTAYVTPLENGKVRYKNDQVVFDDNKDGSYTFYIQSLSTVTVPLQVEFAGTPDDFNYNASLSFSNELIARPSDQSRQTDNGFVRNITFHSAGDTTLNVLSDEGNKKTSIEIKVVEIASSVSFIKNNYALTKTNGNYIDLSRGKVLKVLPGDSSVLKVSYAFGTKDTQTFTAFSDMQLWGYGLNFDRLNNILSVTNKDDLDIDSFWIEATYENPLGENLKAYTEVSVVNEVEESSFEIFLGKSRLDAEQVDSDGNYVNKISEGNIQNLIHNITDLNYVDVVLKVKSNGEKVEFGVIDDGKLPINKPLFEVGNIEYTEIVNANTQNEKEQEVNDYQDAIYTYIHLRLVADKKTVENINYSSDGIYNLGFVCNYADYTVEGYPVSTQIGIKIYDLIKQFSVNNEKVERGSILDDKNFADYFQTNVYINTSDNLDGTVLNVDVFSPATILNEYSQYTLSLYSFDATKGEGEQFVKISDVPNYFRIQKAIGSSTNKTNTTNNLSETFDKNTTFYIKANETSGNIKINQTYYLIIESVLPNNEAFAGKDVESQKAKATIRLDVVQGITEIESYDYYANNYQVDELTGKYTRVDPDTKQKLLYDATQDKYYKLTDGTQPDVEANRTYVDGELVIRTLSNSAISFSDTFVGNEVIYLDLTSGFNANVILNYLPVGANLQNLKIESSDKSVFDIGTYTYEDGEENLNKNAFSIIPKGVGEAEVLISTSNLEQIYKISVSVYKPITNMFVALSSTLWRDGIGSHTTVVDANTQNRIVESAVVMVGKSIRLNISTLPIATNEYTMEFSFYEWTGEGYDMTSPAGSYTSYYDGTVSSEFAYISNEVFTFNCKSNVFVFSQNATTNDKVLLVIKLINLDGTYLERKIELSSFVPVVSIDTTPNKDVTVTNPNTVAYELKTNDLNDPSVFALKVEVNKKATNATFDFNNYGYIRFLYNGKTETFEVKNGMLVQNTSNKILLPISLQADANGNFLFKLNPEYNYSASYNSIVMTIEVKEFDNYFSKLLYVYIKNNTLVSSLRTESETELYFKQGLTDNKVVNFEIENERADNKTVLVKTFNILQKDNKIYYVEATSGTFNTITPVELSQVSEGAYSFEVQPENAGEAVVILMPQDKIISRAHYDTWNNYSYQTINIETGEFVENFYYVYEDGSYVLATSYDAGATYFVKSVQVSSYVTLWKDYLAFYVTVADGEKVPYQVFSLEDLQDISKSYDSVVKRYVLVKNLILDTTHNWVPIGNYYVENVNEEDYEAGKYFVNSNGHFIVCEEIEFDENKTYYLYGFNGEFNFRYNHVDIKQNVILEDSYAVLNIAFAGSLSQENSVYGMFSYLGKDANILWATLSYNFYQPRLTSDFVFGGVAGVNYGTILNAQVSYDNVVFETISNASVGGIVGINYGLIKNEDSLVVTTKGVVKVNVSTLDSQPKTADIGGIVGTNYSVVSGSFIQEGEMVPVFNDAGFDSSLNLVVDIIEGKTSSAVTSIGGAVGRNAGKISNVSIQGNITANKLDNVGGLVGTNEYSQEFNDKANGIYSLENSYSIAKVIGNNNVGGAIGSAVGVDANSYVQIYNISAENYATVFNKDKTFVTGNANVGGLVGQSSFAEFNYCYSVSYFDNITIKAEDLEVTTNYDVIGSSKVGGFVGSATNSNFTSVSSSVYSMSDKDEIGIFAGYNDEVSKGTNIFATGTIHSVSNKAVLGLGLDVISGFAYYNYSTYNLSREVETYIDYFNGSQFKLSGVTVEEIIDFFNEKVAEYSEDVKNGVDEPRAKWTEYWAIDGSESEEKINNGLPYLTLNGNALYATVPLLVSAKVLDVDAYQSYTTHIKYDDSSLVLFYNYDYLNAYAEYADRVQNLNLLSLNELATLKVFAETYKSYRLDISVSGKGVLDILSDGTIKILGEGSEEIIISSKLNSKYQTKIYVVVKYGVNDINLYSNISFTTNLDDCEGSNKIETLKSRNYSLYVEQTYTRSITENAEDTELINAKLRSTNDIGVRFKVSKAQVEQVVANTENARDINDLFKFNGLNWQDSGSDDSTYYYIDVPKKQNIFISPIMAFEDVLTIEYVPYLSETFNSRISTIYLEKFAGSFEFNVKKGATKIMLESNKDNLFSLSQLQTQSFTVTMYTDYEDDALVEDFSALVYETYNDNNIWEVINSSNANLEAGQGASDLLTIVRSDIKRNYSDKNGKLLESISITYTINYKDKVNAVNKDKLFRFKFVAFSDTTVDLTVGIIILGQDKINQIYGTVYSSLSDFPQTPEKNNIIYNGNVGVLSIEVYPFFSNYDKLRVRYESALNYPMLMTQLSYNITANTGDRLVDYPESGSVSDFNEYLWLEKSSGQDTYLLNDLGLYSYSKTYFISLLVSTLVPDDTIYTIYVDILNYQNDIIDTYTIDIKTVAQPGITFGFDERTMGSDNKYYLPLNTVNKLDVSTHNYEGDIEWEVTSLTGFELTEEMKNVLTPYLDLDGNYYFKVMEYLGANKKNIFNLGLLGHTLQIKGSIEDGRNAPKFGQNYFTIEVVVSLFTVLDVTVQNVVDGYMTLPISSTTPLYAYVDAYYDNALTDSTDNWYVNVDRLELEESLRACGYEIEDSFSNYITQLQNALSKARYSTEEEDEIKTSGVWFYSTEDGASSYLQSAKSYNSNTFGVELYNDYFSVYGRQIDKNTSLSLRLSLAYTNSQKGDKRVVGIPNVLGYNVSPTNTTYESLFSYNKDFILNFVYKSDLIDAIPVSTAEEFLSMQKGFDYRLIADIELSGYTPLSTEIASFDGNNHTIYITSFVYNNDTEEEVTLGLFDSVSVDTILYNVKVCYTNRVEVVNQEMQSVANGLLTIGLLKSPRVTFGGIAATNNGTLTNCQVTGAISINLNADVNIGTIGVGVNGGLVANNASTGYITNSKVINFNLSCYGSTGGIVQNNSGKIISTYLDQSSINNFSSDATGGFVHTNSGEIYECFAQGNRLSTDNDIRNTGTGISSKGIVSGFVYSNSNLINDCYSNIKLSSSRYIAGFVHEDSASSIISRCYSICYKDRNDNAIVASPFFGTNDITKITVNGQLINCYFLKGTGTWIDNGSFVNTAQDKVPVGLTFDEFATHTSFTNYDLSLTYKSAKYADGTTYNYVDGYTWVIIEGKPLIVSSLVNTVSERSYEGKNKKYSSNFNLFAVPTSTSNTGDNSVIVDVVPGGFGENKEKYYYYNGFDAQDKPYTSEDLAKVPENLLYSVVVDYSAKTMTYTFEPREVAANETSQLLTLVYSIEIDGGNNIISKKVLYAEYGEESKSILDVREETKEGFVDDENYRANDTIVIKYKGGSDLIQISSIDYYVLESASYYYSNAVHGKSYGSGTRTNPQMVYDYISFSTYLSSNTKSNYYRIIKDIDFEYNFTKTSYSNFQGALQGNYMTLSRLSISYISNIENVTGEKVDEENKNSFGLFAKISTIENSDYKEFTTTIISNVKLAVVEVLSNTHKFVGALAGQIDAYGNGDMSRNVILNNINIEGYQGGRAFVQGNNAVGGLVGYATGNVIIKDITTSVSVNATKEMDVGYDAKTMLYNSVSDINQDTANISYAGGVVGVFDASTIIDYSTLKNYNANNIYVSGEVTVIGGVSGGAYGLIGQNTIVNYTNVLVQTSDKNFVKALSYAGGIVGENRGSVISSSITYGSRENYSSVQPGETNLITTNFFYNGGSGNTVVAIGGIAGLNNGGTISNSISTVDVRNVNATIAGGAVGRLIQGTIENVIASGSVMADSIVGGLIGTLNDRDIVTSAGYSKSAIIELANNSNIKTVLSNNVSANNWLVNDYTTYTQMLLDSKIVGGYIGLVSHTGVLNQDGTFDFVEFKGTSYFANTLYTSRTSQKPKSYLKVAYASNSFDNSSLIEQQAIDVLINTSGQAVYPYSIREMYYENTLIGPYYTIKSLANYPNYKEQAINPFVQFIYEIVESSSVININTLYKKIDLSDASVWQNLDRELFNKNDEDAYDWLKAHFGNIFEYKDGKYEIVTKIVNTNRNGKVYNYFYIPSDNLSVFETEVTYLASENDIVPYEIDITKDGSIYKVNNLTSIVVNGNQLKSNNMKFKDNSTLSFVLEDNIELGIELPNGVKVTDVKFEAEEKEVVREGNKIYIYSITSMTVKYAYDTTTEYIKKVVNSTSDINTDEYRLSVSSKQVIYNSFIDNGYWLVQDNFFLNNDYNNAVKYLTNLENAEVYVWEEFKKDFDGAVDNITQSYSGDIVISTAEEFALFAYYVNNSQSYEGKTVRLDRDIDLSGKYWMPIGIDEYHPFKGTFDAGYYDEDGNLKGRYTIKYATVNEKLNENESFLKYAGIFGVTQNAEIKNLVVSGGDIEGEIAGGIVGYAIGNVRFDNVTNRNTVVGLQTAGGLVGYTQSCTLLNAINYGEIDVKESYSYNVYVGGLVGSANSINIGNGSVNNIITNYGSINVFNLKTSYADGAIDSKAKVNVGGIVGITSNLIINNEVSNRGDIHITTNAHYLNVGGIVGINGATDTEFSSTTTLTKMRNFGDIEVNYNNIRIQNDTNSASAHIGGLVGKTGNNIVNSGNEGTVALIISTTTSAYISVGGVVGTTNANITNCYNSNNINVLTIGKKTEFGVGGIGGIVGLVNATMNGANPTYHTVKDCYNAGDIFYDGNAFMFVGGIYGSSYIIDELKNNMIIFTSESSFNDITSINTIENCLNIGYVNITTFRSSQNGLGAIAGINTFLQQKSNYYLIDSAYSGSDIFTSVCALDTTASNSETVFKALTDEETNYGNESGDDVIGAVAKRTTSLKTLDDCYLFWDFGSANPVWVQSYDTWYPTLNGNESSSLWTDKQEVVSQEKGYYVVRTAEQLSYIASQINSGELDSNGIAIKLANSIDLSNRFWTPIGTRQNPFKGTFDGNNYVIRNLTIDGNVLDTEYLQSYNYGALFGYVTDGTILNVGLESAIIQNVKYAASLVCFAENTRIEKVYSDKGNSDNSQIMAKDAYESSFTIGAGGLVYSMTNCSPLESNNMKGGLYYSYNNVPVAFGVGTGEFNAISYIGGLVGSMTNSLIDNSYNNSKGVVSLYTDKTADDISGYSISGNVDKTSSLFNVFNLAPIAINGNENSAKIKLFTVDYNQVTGVTKVVETMTTPEFENLDTSGEVDIKSIWTNEYSLNEESYSSYPFLRGLGKEWKNTESEGLKSYTYSNDDTINLENQLLSTVLQDSNTLFKIENPTLSYIQSASKKVYVISTSEDLAWLATNVNNGNLTTTNCEFILTADIDLTGRYWTPIGTTSVYPFQGVFNFNGHVISGLTIDSNNLTYGGLFGYTSNAYICNGYIKNAFVKISRESATTNIYVGTLVGKGYNTTIENISVTTNLVAFSNSAAFIGGIIGSLTGTSDYIISNVTVNTSNKASGVGADAQITERYIDTSIYKNYISELGNSGEFNSSLVSIGAFSTGGNVYCGGVAGYMSGYYVNESNSEYLLNSATNNVNIAAVSISNASNVFLGGILGYGLEEVTLNVVQNNGKLKSFSNQSDIIGGIVGYLYNGSVSNAYFGGYIEGTQDGSHIRTYLGGIIGILETAGSVKYAVNAGTINSNADYKEIATVGGIIGQTIDHLFTADLMSAFNSSEYGFAKAVGFVEYREGYVATETEKDYNLVFSTSVSGFDITKAPTCWTKTLNDIILIVPHIYLNGCQTSFGYEESRLSDKGVLVNTLNVELKYTSDDYDSSHKIAFGVVDRNFNYYYIETQITGNPFNLQSLLTSAIEVYNNSNNNKIDIILADGSLDTSKLSTLYVTMIKPVEDGQS